ncbi:probable WRKY transcription factor 32 [Ziziphus jujuba]|uniref:Probable WRKY transcription factor 32 n=1 Tax=Ziziphus jujuba TaxID=326968 RepID=A0A6P4A9D9_ZIZJJ|nr:probable WRKY transcription factor 32 [Ziziphus jujuba]
MAEQQSFKAPEAENTKTTNEQVEEEEEPEEDDEDELEGGDEDDEEEAEEEEVGGDGGGELQVGEFQSSEQLVEVEVKQSAVETLAVPSSEDDQRAVLLMNSTSQSNAGAQFEEQVTEPQPEVLASVAPQDARAKTENRQQFSACPAPLSELSPTSVTQSISAAPSPTLLEQRLSPPKVTGSCMLEADQHNSLDVKTLPSIPVLKSAASDGYNWRKYGQKQVKSPKGSRSYYKCTYSECFAKKIECCDHSGHVTEIVYKNQHTHDPPRKSNCTRESKLSLATERVLGNNVTEHQQSSRTLNDSDPSTSSKELTHETLPLPERKRQNSITPEENGDIKVKEEHGNEPEPKRRMKKSNVEYPGSLLKPGKKPKFVVHAAGDVGISGDGYRWRKYGQKMVKGNPHPRNYYRCTSAGCPVRKHIETAVDNTNAVVITYKGIHDHDMPVPKKRHGPPSAPLVAAAAPASMSNLQLKKTETHQNQTSSTQWSVDNEGELTGEALDLGGEKAMESARTLLSIGFEIKPC